MFFLFGVNGSAVDQYPLQDCACPNCASINTLYLQKKGQYFHFFLIPMFPTGYSTKILCKHCRKVFTAPFSAEIQQQIDEREKGQDSKRPLWHCCGCSLILLALLGLVVSGIFVKCSGASDEDQQRKDNTPGYREYKADYEKLTSKPDCAIDSVSCAVKKYIDYALTDELKKDEIEYFSRVKGDSILVLMHVDQMGKVKGEQRAGFVTTITEALQLNYGTQPKHMFIGVHGRWNMCLVYTPDVRQLGGSFADEDNLYKFYEDRPSVSKLKKEQ